MARYVCLVDCHRPNEDGRATYYEQGEFYDFKKPPGEHFMPLENVKQGAPTVTSKTAMKKRGVQSAPLSAVKFNPGGGGAEINIKEK